MLGYMRLGYAGIGFRVGWGYFGFRVSQLNLCIIGFIYSFQIFK